MSAPSIPQRSNAQTAWESVPTFIRFVTWVAAILFFMSTIGAVITFVVMMFTGLLVAMVGG